AISFSCSSLQGDGCSAPAEHALDAIGVGGRDVELPREPALAARRLLLEDVVEVDPPPADLAGAGDLEALLRAAVGLHLGHLDRFLVSRSVGPLGPCFPALWGRSGPAIPLCGAARALPV